MRKSKEKVKADDQKDPKQEKPAEPEHKPLELNEPHEYEDPQDERE